MKKTNFLLATIFLVMLLTVLPLVNAAVTVDLPIADTNYTTEIDIYVQYENATDEMTDALSANTTCYYNASGTWATVGALSSFTINATGFTATIDIDALTDGTGISFNCSVSNVSTLTVSDTINGIMFDSTDPLCTLTKDHRTMPWKGIQQVDWTSSDVIEWVSTSVNIDGPDTQTTLTYTDANRQLTLTSQDTKYIGDWTANITATDRAGNTCTDEVTWSTYLPDGDIQPGYGYEPPAKGNQLLLLIVVIAIIYFVFIRK